jgi:hypothetical protein
MKVWILASLALTVAGSSPAAADVTIRQYYQQPVPAPYPSQNNSRGAYLPPSPQAQHPLTPAPQMQPVPQPVGPYGTPVIRLKPNR